MRDQDGEQTRRSDVIDTTEAQDHAARYERALRDPNPPKLLGPDPFYHPDEETR